MHKLRVGVVVNPDLVPSLGGAYSYYSTLLKGLNNYDFDDSIDIINIIFYNKVKPNITLNKTSLFIEGLAPSEVKKSVKKRLIKFGLLKRIFFPEKIFSSIKKNSLAGVVKVLEQEKIDLLYYLTPVAHNIDFPYIITHWDLAHKTTFSFPEITMNGNYESRDNYYSGVLNKALMILCESETSIKELSTLYNIDQKKLALFPIFGNDALSLIDNQKNIQTHLSKFNLEDSRFFLYPAQFWSLKNHYNLIIAFNIFLKDQRKDNTFKLILCGSDKGNMKYILSLIDDLGLKDSIIITGFIENEELHSLYKHACAMVFPAFLGPTNMPLIEAAQLGCPIICSNLDGHKEILDVHALYFEPTDPNDIATNMAKIANNSVFRQSLIKNAQNHIKESKFNLKKSLFLLNNTLIKVKAIRKTWGLNSMINADV
ncbi:glycosyltransferase family 4 protein [Pedobacter mucosus]|uniref:glycosyltransferase family 4 protein n=1 Tax=Pedobacter mucosus TaxID=2895286 RepID=UPI001EE47CFC|nr:glycosyltransferase family 1 protein [Pedobacter mucosus]UKT63336.1 glycosyltransferase family 4 protein [Pedobacter mucosus]